ncbi:hypothetical protein DXG01_014002 [Tephrocybe rancida]|nr:hypothetical protein DXG01_014002 [Tephrocybe rancida]
MGQGLGAASAAASFSFKGSAIYIESALNFFSPIYTVTLDGVPTDVDGVRASGAFICAPLFSKTGLDPNIEHTVRLSIKGPSPNRNMTFPDSAKDFVFSLASYTFTEGGDTNKTTPVGSGNGLPSDSATASTSNNSGSTTTSGSAAVPTTSEVPSSAQTLYKLGSAVLVAALTVSWVTYSSM